ncbi:MAG: hypothetical protein PHU03_08085 [Syntrophales bacterium]|nr:hypothetical protein [Syntrophales bacterium]
MRRFAALVLTLLCTVSWALATTMTIKFKDGTTVKYDTARIESVNFSEAAAPVAQEGTNLFEETFPSGLSESKTQDLYWAQNVWFHIGRPSVTSTSSDLSNTQNGGENYGSAKGPAAFPGTVTLTIKPGFVSVETSTGIKQEGKFAWLKPGSSAYLYIFSHPTAEGLPAAFVLEKIRMFTGR